MKRRKNALLLLCASGFLFCFMASASAEIASVEYVNRIVNAISYPQADWAQTNPNATDFIKNKPEIPVAAELEHISNKVDVISDTATDAQYPSARAVSDALATKAGTDDAKFDSISTSRPAGTPPAGRVFIWFN